MRTSRPCGTADSRRLVIVLPPRVVSKAKSRRLAMADSRSRTPSRHAALFASAWVMPGLRSRIVRAAVSGLKYNAPASSRRAPRRLLFPPPFGPARTTMRAGRTFSATLAGRRDGGLADLFGGCLERRLHRGPHPWRLHAGEH